MSQRAPKPTKSQAAEVRPKRRIETQIHRRKKVKTSFPLEAEWDSTSKEPPGKLKMPPEEMKK